MVSDFGGQHEPEQLSRDRCATFFRVRGRDPFQQFLARNHCRKACARSHRSSAMPDAAGAVNDKSDLCGVCTQVAPHTPEVTGPGNAARMNQQTGRDVKVNRESNRCQHKQAPEQCRAGKDRPGMRPARGTSDGANKTATQIVENLPARDQRQRVADSAPCGVRYSWKQPAQNLPVAARPAVLAFA